MESEVDKAHSPVRFTDVGLGIRDAEVCLTCHFVLDEPDDWPEDQEWSYPFVQVPWPCPARVEIDRLDTIARMYQPTRNEADRLRAAVERVRALCAEPNSMGLSKRLAVKVEDVLRALDAG